MFCVFLFSTPASHSPLVLLGHSALPPPHGGSVCLSVGGSVYEHALFERAGSRHIDRPTCVCVLSVSVSVSMCLYPARSKSACSRLFSCSRLDYSHVAIPVCACRYICKTYIQTQTNEMYIHMWPYLCVHLDIYVCIYISFVCVCMYVFVCVCVSISGS